MARREPEAPPPWPAYLHTDDEINAWMYASHQDHPVRELLDESHEVFQQLFAAIDRLSETELADVERQPWMGRSALERRRLLRPLPRRTRGESARLAGASRVIVARRGEKLDASLQAMCPHFPKGDVDNPERPLAWEQVEQELATSKHYRLCSVRPDGRPHAVLRWAVWVEGRIYDDGSPETRHARNIALNPNVSVHLESGVRAVMLEGAASAMKPSHELAVHIADEYTAKYPALGYAPKPDSWDAGGLFASTPQRVIAWTSFAEAPTKFVLDAAPG